MTRACRIAAWLLLAAVAVFTLSPVEMRPVSTAPVDWERFAAFAAVGGAFCLGYPKHRLAIILMVLAAVGLLEALQDVVPGRHGRISDGVFKASGALTGATVATIAQRMLAIRKVRGGRRQPHPVVTDRRDG